MRILLDLQTLQSESRARGIGRYSRGLAGALLRDDRDGQLSVLLNSAVTEGLRQRELAHRQDPRLRHGCAGNAWEELDGLTKWLKTQRTSLDIRHFQGMCEVAGMLAPSPETLTASELIYDAFLTTCQVDIVHQQSAFDGFGDNTVIGGSSWDQVGPARAFTVYDLIAHEDPDFYLADPNRRSWYFRRVKTLEKADLLLTISEHTRQVVLRRLRIKPERVVNIGTDTDPLFRKKEISPTRKQELLRRYGLSRPFLMHVGILEERKNVAALIRAVAALPEALRNAYQLLLVADATEPQKKSLEAVARRSGVDPSALVFPGFVPDSDLVDLYGLSFAMVMPSFSEGFGLPVLEAMRCGAAVLASRATSLPEVLGADELLFDPHNTVELSQKLYRILTEPDFRAFAISHGEKQEKLFSWDRSANTAYCAFQETVARRNSEQNQAAGRAAKYIIVPALIPDSAEQALERSVYAKIENYSGAAQYANFDGPAQQSEASRNQLGSKERAVILSSSGDLDLRQQLVLARMPAIVITPASEKSKPSPELLYLITGYSALLSGSAQVRVASLTDAFSQLAAALTASAELEDVEQALETHFSSIVSAVLSWLPPLLPRDQAQVASALFANHRPAPARPRLFVDISELTKSDAKSGIQRVVRNIIRELLRSDFGFRVEPIYRDNDEYRYARQFTCKFLRIDSLRLSDSLVDFHPSDTFLGLDLDLTLTQRAADRLHAFRLAGGSVNFVVYDILPVRRPDWFPKNIASLFLDWLNRIACAGTRLIAISRTVAQELADHLASSGLQRAQPAKISWYHNGADFETDIPFVCETSDPDFEKLFRNSASPLFLTVGTLEPRKGIAQLIEAADYFWRHQDARFVLVGKHGWLVDDLANKIHRHPKFGRRLFWFESIPDEVLTTLYRIAAAVILPSEAEGFGLPLVEAACRGVPVIARDLPVFREVGGDGAFYFTADSGDQLGHALLEWIKLRHSGQAPDPTLIHVNNWMQSADQLIACVKGCRADIAMPS
jgi:glycosyltransferase involved in cell wall biosynthesis